MSSDPRDGENVMYRSRPDLYDRIYHWKNYAGETLRIWGLLAACGIPDGARVLEAACGTGNYLVQLVKHYDAAGFDRHEPVAEIARRKAPAARVFTADMADFDAGAPVDALLCLFSSFGYVPPAQIPAAAACFARAVRKGGVALVEAWITPEEAIPNKPVLQTYDGSKASPPEDLQVARGCVHAMDGRRSVFDFHWLVVSPQGVEHFVDRHVLWISSRDELGAAFSAAGFEVTWLSSFLVPGRSTMFLRRM